MTVIIDNLSFDIETLRLGTDYLNGDDSGEIIVALAPNYGNPTWYDNRLEGRGGDDILLGNYGRDVLNPGSGNGYVFASEGADKVYIDHTGVDELTGIADEVIVNFHDSDNAVDTLIFGNDMKQFGETLGTTFVTVKGWGKEDRLLMRDFDEVNGYYYTTPNGVGDLLVYAAHGCGNLSVLLIEDVEAQGIDVNIFSS